jgi:equilibrative nucleoside transporter 1/2/3
MANESTVDRVRALFAKDNEQEYAALRSGSDSDDPLVYRPVLLVDGNEEEDAGEDRLPLGAEAEFSWIEYLIFMLLGVAMLWAW